MSIPWRHIATWVCVAVNILFSQSCEFKLLHTSRCANVSTSWRRAHYESSSLANVPAKDLEPNFTRRLQRFAKKKNASIRYSNRWKPAEGGAALPQNLMFPRFFSRQDTLNGRRFFLKCSRANLPGEVFKYFFEDTVQNFEIYTFLFSKSELLANTCRKYIHPTLLFRDTENNIL